MNPKDFEHLNEAADVLKDEFKTFNDIDDRLNEYGEIEDQSIETENNDTESIGFEGNTLNTEDDLALPDTLNTSPLNPNLDVSWKKRSYLAVNETDKEFEMFKIFCMYGGGRSLSYISTICNISINTLNRVATKNNWKRRSEDYDRAELVKKIQQSKTSKHELHIRKLEKYREEQEALGQQLTLNAARIAFIANSTLSKMLDDDRQLDARDLPGMLNVAAKLADVGKNLQSSSLGVDNLLAALEEAEGE